MATNTSMVRDGIVIAIGIAGVVAFVTWWTREAFEQVPAPSPVGLGPADPAQHFGADAASDQDLADAVLAETHGDVDVAEARFDERRATSPR